MEKDDKHGKDALINTGDSILNLFSPVAPLQTIRSIGNWFIQRRENAFNEKLEFFLTETHGISEEEKQGFLKKLDKNQEDFFYRIINIIDRLDEKEKSTILGRSFKAFALGEIESSDVLKLGSLLDRLYIDDLHFFKQNCYSNAALNRRFSIGFKGRSEFSTLRFLASIGLLEEITKVSPEYDQSQIEHTYQLTDIGLILKAYV